ncbi:MAG TPA: hypothetical protein VEK11_12745 [Thermoanaerobaculia bacterium]|jgi:tetratricopeptide (TPR) repeat protein|nr:hypothetical protein [Thermoanaerobaculia bacterium]
MTAPVLELYHPDDETLAAFVDDRASEEKRAMVIEHMNVCADCRDVVLMATDVAFEEPANLVRPRFGGRWLAPLAAAAAVGAVFLIPDVRYKVFGINPGALVAASGTLVERPTEGQLSLPVPYLKHDRMRGGVEDSETARIAVILGNNEASLRPNRWTRGLGLLMLATTRPEYDAAVAELQEALAKADARDRDAITIDLSAALLERNAYRAGDDQPDAHRALALADEVWNRTKSPKALWNRGLALQTLRREHEANAVWNEYLKLDPDSQWAEEVRSEYLEAEPELRPLP